MEMGLPSCLAAWLVILLVGWLVGWLVGLFACACGGFCSVSWKSKRQILAFEA